MTDLFEVLRDEVDVTLFKGGGEPAARERVVRHLTRTGIAARLFGERLRYRRYQLEFLTFALMLLPHLARGRFDVVHFIDPPLARYLAWSRRLLGQSFRLVFSDAGPASYDASRWVDHIHTLTPAAQEATLARGVPASRSSMVPVGVHTNPVSPKTRDAVRSGQAVGRDTLVILAVTTLNRHHKRVDHLIEEVAGLEGDFLLWLDGSTHPDGDPSLLDLAAARLGSRFRHTHVASDRVADLYQAADVFVSSAISESFGMSIVEAMAAGLPVVTHDSPHFEWLTANAGTRLDMSQRGALRSHLQNLLDNGRGRLPADVRDDVLGRLGWPALRKEYVGVYRSARALPER